MHSLSFLSVLFTSIVLLQLGSVLASFQCPPLHHVMRIEGATKVVNGRITVGALRFTCSNNLTSTVFGSK